MRILVIPKSQPSDEHLVGRMEVGGEAKQSWEEKEADLRVGADLIGGGIFGTSEELAKWRAFGCNGEGQKYDNKQPTDRALE